MFRGIKIYLCGTTNRKSKNKTKTKKGGNIVCTIIISLTEVLRKRKFQLVSKLVLKNILFFLLSPSMQLKRKKKSKQKFSARLHRRFSLFSKLSVAWQKFYVMMAGFFFFDLGLFNGSQFWGPQSIYATIFDNLITNIVFAMAMAMAIFYV